MWALFIAANLAWGDNVEALASVDEVPIPITPSSQDEYVALFEVDAATGSWTSDHPSFQCEGVGDYLQIKIARATWPSVLPKKVTCREDGGKQRKVKSKVIVDPGIRHEPMLVSDGTLVMPRDHKASAIYRGPVPNPDLVVQRGTTGSLSIHCKVIVGPELEVVVDPESKDGEGLCTLRDRHGDTMRVPIRIITAKYN